MVPLGPDANHNHPPVLQVSTLAGTSILDHAGLLKITVCRCVHFNVTASILAVVVTEETAIHMSVYEVLSL